MFSQGFLSTLTVNTRTTQGLLRISQYFSGFPQGFHESKGFRFQWWCKQSEIYLSILVNLKKYLPFFGQQVCSSRKLLWLQLRTLSLVCCHTMSHLVSYSEQFPVKGTLPHFWFYQFSIHEVCHLQKRLWKVWLEDHYR